jgi:hypothetical protein
MQFELDDLLAEQRLGQESRNLRGLDLESSRRNTAIAYAIPIRVKLPTRWPLHYSTHAKRYSVPSRPPKPSAEPR